MFYGPSGAGKKTRIMCLLREMYGSGVERLRSETMTFTTPSNRKIEVMTVSSNYHLEVNPSDAGMYDRTVVIDLIKQVAQTHQIEISGQREFKVIVISEGDELTKDAQHALRRTMEKYVATCRIIISVNSTSRIIPATGHPGGRTQRNGDRFHLAEHLQTGRSRPARGTGQTSGGQV